MFSLMDKVPNGVEPMLKDLEEHIMSAGLADMVAAAESITSVSEPHLGEGHSKQALCKFILSFLPHLVLKVLNYQLDTFKPLSEWLRTMAKG